MKFRIFILTFAAFSFTAFQANAQVDLSLNALGIIFGGTQAGADFAFTEDISTELSIGYNSRRDDDRSQKYTSIPVQVLGKYYLGPDDGADNFYVGLFLRLANRSYTNDGSSNFAELTQSRFGGGLGLGYKIVTQSNVIFDFGLTLGKVLSDSTKFKDSDGVREEVSIPGVIVGLRAGVGYRFGS
jgi:hypothetical protein